LFGAMFVASAGRGLIVFAGVLLNNECWLKLLALMLELDCGLRKQFR